MTQDHELLQLAALFDFLEDVIVWVKDCQGVYRWVNRAFLLDYEASHPQPGALSTPLQIIGKTDYDLSPAHLADQFRLDDEHVLAGNPIVNRIELVGQPDGVARWNITNKIPLFDRQRAVVGTAGLTRRLKTSDEEGVLEPMFGRVLLHLRDHYATPLTNRELAKLAYMSLRAFERKFLNCFHLTPQQYLRKLRLRVASRALVFGDQPLVKVAMSCGFSDQSHFTREFHRHFGRTPREYREFYTRLPLSEQTLALPSKNAPSRRGRLPQ
jgi:AraC-like DNA-binding protein